MKQVGQGSSSEKMDIDENVVKEEDEVLFEMDCYNIPLSRQHFSVATLQFQSEKPAKLDDCTVRMKPVVKHIEIDYQNGADRDDGVKPGIESTTFSGKGTSESEVLNHALGFIDDNKMYFVEVDAMYKMRRKVTRSSEDVVEESDSKRNLSPVRVKFARAETEAQRKRREQSSFFKHQQAAQEAWKDVVVVKEEPNYPLKILSREVEEEMLPTNGLQQIKEEIIEK
ncbi:hypothetical protein FO519_002330 [Halicephalobus sp. NKZ332]|nr:hypothetical protein FO519_002330 [Halicephalobus sp. NKZ332]